MNLTHHIILTILWVISAVFDYLATTYIWQLKEYRLDRLRDFIGSKQGRIVLTQYRYVWRALLALVLYTAFHSVGPIIWIFYVLLLIDLLINIKQYKKHELRRPTFTHKAILILILSAVLEIILVTIFHTPYALLWGLVLRSILVSLIVVFVSVPTNLIKKSIILRATKKISRYPNLKIIGITGSYGKTTVKEFTSHILSKKYNVKKTPENTNTDIGVAKYILASDFSKTDVFVVEMGAYKIGEIRAICDIVKPKIGILTAINPQHVSLFGSLKNIQTAKYELLRSIPEDGLVITNSDNALCRTYLGELTCKNIQTFGIDGEHDPSCLIEDIVSNKDGVACTGKHHGTEVSIEAPVLGKHQVFNIAPAVLAAGYVGMDMESIQKAAKTLKNASKTALKVRKYGSSWIIDDSYNSNPDGFKAALEILSSYPSSYRRVVVTRGMMELGDISHELHVQMGEEIAFCADELVIIHPDSADDLLEGAQRLEHKFNLDTHTILDPEKILKHLKKYKDAEAVILLENRIPSFVYDQLQ